MPIFNSANLQVALSSKDLPLELDVALEHKLYIYDGISLEVPASITAELWQKSKTSRSNVLVTDAIVVTADIVDLLAYKFAVTIPSASYTAGNPLFYKIKAVMSDGFIYEETIDIYE
jgi:hypothetical protein